MFDDGDDRSKSSRGDSRGRKSRSPPSDKGYNPNMYYGKERDYGKEREYPKERGQYDNKRARGYDSRYRREDSRGYQRDDRERYYSKRDTKVYQKTSIPPPKY